MVSDLPHTRQETIPASKEGCVVAINTYLRYRELVIVRYNQRARGESDAVGHWLARGFVPTRALAQSNKVKKARPAHVIQRIKCSANSVHIAIVYISRVFIVHVYCSN